MVPVRQSKQLELELLVAGEGCTNRPPDRPRGAAVLSTAPASSDAMIRLSLLLAMLLLTLAAPSAAQRMQAKCSACRAVAVSSAAILSC